MSDKPKQAAFDIEVPETDEVERLIGIAKNMGPTKEEWLNFLDRDWELAKAQQAKDIAFYNRQSDLYKSLNKRPPEITIYMRRNRSAYMRLQTR